MKKADLKTGMILKNRKGKLGMVLLGTPNGDIVSGETWFPLTALRDNLTSIHGEDSDILQVYKPVANVSFLHEGVNTEGCNLIWKHEVDVETIQELRSKIKEAQERLEEAQRKLNEITRG